jgi:hypothetical protein
MFPINASTYITFIQYNVEIFLSEFNINVRAPEIAQVLYHTSILINTTFFFTETMVHTFFLHPDIHPLSIRSGKND